MIKTLSTILAGAMALGSMAYAKNASAEIPLDIDGVIPAAAANAGSHSTYWETTVWATNPTEDDALFTIYAGNQEREAQADEFVQIRVGADQTIRLDNIMVNFPNLEPPAALFYNWDGIDPDQGAVDSRTFTVRPNGVPGTMGQGIPGIDLEDRKPGRAQYVPLATTTEHFRSNIGIVNANNSDMVVELTLHQSGGVRQETITRSLNRYSWLQEKADTMFSTPVSDGFYVTAMPVDSIDDEYFIYSSVIDNRTGDPTYFEEQTTGDGELLLLVPAVANLNGANNSTWISDVIVGNTGKSKNLSLGYMLADQDNTNPAAVTTEGVGAGAFLVLDDIVGKKFHKPGTKGAAFTSTVAGDNVNVWSRTYNTTEEGTYGQGLSGLNWETTGIMDDIKGVISGLVNNDNYRSNIGLVNISNDPTTVTIKLHNEGTITTITEELQPYEMTQLNNIFEDDHASRAHATITATTGNLSGKVIAYGSVIDNNSNDPTTKLAKAIGPAAETYTVEDYVDYWMGVPEENIFLANTEIRRLINGSDRTESYVDALAHAVFDNSDPQLPGDVNLKILGYQQNTDGDLNNGEYWQSFDPIVLSPTNSLLRDYHEPDGRVGNWGLTPTGVTAVRDVFRNFLIDHVGSYPELYDYDVNTHPREAMDRNGPTWWSGDPNPFFNP